MRLRVFVSIVFAIALAMSSGAQTANEVESCDMQLTATHIDKDSSKIYSSETGLQALYYRANMDVNTDGAARSYHPEDPRAQSIAFNNMGNAISKIFDVEGNNINCSPRQGACYTSFIETFVAARDAQYNPNGHPRVETKGIIPWELNEQLGWDVPCTIQTGENAGYFVSQTSVIVDASKGRCDQGRYLDSLTVNANVLPLGMNWRSQGIITDKTDLVVARDMDTGKIAYGINGDRGPEDKIGEGSIAFASALSGTELKGDETYAEIRSLARANVEYLIFPTRDIFRLTGGTFDQDDVERFARTAFDEWGGASRLDACGSLQR